MGSKADRAKALNETQQRQETVKKLAAQMRAVLDAVQAEINAADSSGATWRHFLRTFLSNDLAVRLNQATGSAYGAQTKYRVYGIPCRRETAQFIVAALSVRIDELSARLTRKGGDEQKLDVLRYVSDCCSLMRKFGYDKDVMGPPAGWKLAPKLMKARAKMTVEGKWGFNTDTDLDPIQRLEHEINSGGSTADESKP